MDRNDLVVVHDHSFFTKYREVFGCFPRRNLEKYEYSTCESNGISPLVAMAKIMLTFDKSSWLLISTRFVSSRILLFA